MTAYFYIKAVHIIFVVSWFAGLFYVVRLFIYHVEAYDRPEPERSILTTEYKRIQRLLYNIIMQPAMVLTVATAVAMLLLPEGQVWIQQAWMQVKIGLVLLLLWYHLSCGRMMAELRADVVKWKSGQLRMWNEVATILLVAIVFIVVLKSAFNWIWGVLGLVLFAVLIMLAVRLAKRLREKG